MLSEQWEARMGQLLGKKYEIEESTRCTSKCSSGVLSPNGCDKEPSADDSVLDQVSPSYYNDFPVKFSPERRPVVPASFSS
ncbi:hypothetical protein EJB05_15591, partial [Eragrostis curvula]